MKVLGLDIGITSVGGSLITVPDTYEDWGKRGEIHWLGSRIIPTDGDYLQKFETGTQAQTKAAFRTAKRGSRRLKHRYILRRTRLIKVLKILGWVSSEFPENFKEKIKQDCDFKFNISQYLPFKQASMEEATMLLGIKNKEGKLACSDDWVIYYLRKKALSEKISLSELARIIYMFNQRRGFKSGRKDLKNIPEDSIEKKRVEILTIKEVIQVEDEKDKNEKFKFQIVPDNSTSKEPVEPWEEARYKKPDWEGKEFTFLITVKNGKQLKPRTPDENDYDLLVTALDNKITDSGKTAGTYFFDELVKEKNYKIRQQIVKRTRYQEELRAIWNKQSEFHPELNDKTKLHEISAALYPTQTKAGKWKLKEILSNDLYHVIANDIIYYQRELKSQKGLISGCQYERIQILKNGEKIKMGVKVAPRSSPDFQEFRIWQTIHNIKMYEKERRVDGRTRIDVDVTQDYLGINDSGLKVREKLFELFDNTGEIDAKKIFKTINEFYSSKLSEKTHRINLIYRDGVTIKGNEIKEVFRKAFKKVNYAEEGNNILRDAKRLNSLWHIFYSISSSDAEKSQKGIERALRNPKMKFNFPEEVIKGLIAMPEPPKQYASLSTKAIKKLLPVMRCGNYWRWDKILPEYQIKIQNLIKNGWEKVDKDTGEVVGAEHPFTNVEQVQGLPTWMAAYVIYDRHSERQASEKYTSYDQIDVMKLVPNNSLRNPLVEQIVRETLFVVKDVWRQFGQPDEIHIELSRDLKKNAEERKKISEINTANQQERERIKKLLKELLNDRFEEYSEDGSTTNSGFETKPNPESPLDIEKFKIWKNLAGTPPDEFDKFFKEKKDKLPSNADIKKYVLWLTQHCKSPYTGKAIPLSKLFTELYEVEHIIPRRAMKYDANENLVICETGVNKAKGERMAAHFISESNGKCRYGNIEYTLLSYPDFEAHCKRICRGKKLKNLLATEVPEDFISRQINDTRYITRKITELLQPMPKKENGIILTIGSITSELKREWGLTREWKKLMLPRFKRLEAITGERYVTVNSKNANDFDIQVPENPELDLKRIDHRHHALDALVIAATTREHIRYLNSLNAVDSCEELKKIKVSLVKRKVREFSPPWETFPEDAKNALLTVITSLKAKNRVVSKPKNKHQMWVEQEGKWVKKLVKQKPPKEQGKKWLSIRKSMFKEPQGAIHIKEVYEEKNIIKAIEIQINRMKVQNSPAMKTASYIYDQEAREIAKRLILEYDFDIDAIKKHLRKYSLTDERKNEYKSIKIARFKEYAAKRVSLDTSFDSKKINKIPYSKENRSPLAEILKAHLTEYNDGSKEHPELAFYGEGMEALNKKLKHPINKVTIYEKKSLEDKFKNNYIEVDKGANVYFIIYEDNKTGKRREMYSLPTHRAVERLVAGKPIAEEREGYKTIILSPNQLVYVPTNEELKNPDLIDLETKDFDKRKEIFDRIYKMVSCTGSKCEFVPHNIAKAIIDTTELGSGNKNQRAWDGKVEFKTKREDSGTMIKERCRKISVDRLGNIKLI